MLQIKLSILLLLFSLDQGASVEEILSVPMVVMEGDSITLQTGIEKTKQDRIRWYFNDTRIAQINGDPSKTCTDVKCNEGTERFRDRLKLDHQTGSLTITVITTEDAGDYQLKIFNSNSIKEKIFSVDVRGVPASKQIKSVKEGESVSLDPGAIKKPNDVLRWYFNHDPIAKITGDPSEICSDESCLERFSDRLEVDHQTGVLTITNTRTSDSGLYEVEISSSGRRHRRSISNVQSFHVTVIDPGVSSGVIAGIIVPVVLLVSAAVVVLYYRHRSGFLTRPHIYQGVTIAV